MMAIGFLVAGSSICAVPSFRSSSRGNMSCFTGSCSTSGISTSSTISIFVRPTMWLGRLLWKQGDGWLIDGFGPDGVSARVLDVTRGARAPADRLSLSLRLRHADWRGGFITWFMFGARWADHELACLPLRRSCRSWARCSLWPCAADGEAERRNARWIALWTTLITFAISLILLDRFDPTSAGVSVRREAAWLGGAISYHMGVDGISLPFVILTTALMPVCILRAGNPSSSA